MLCSNLMGMEFPETAARLMTPTSCSTGHAGRSFFSALPSSGLPQAKGAAMQAIPGYLIVFVGAGIGGMLRHAVNQAAVIFGWTFPWHTLLVNVSGCLLMGAVAGWFAFRGASGQDIQLFLTTGILGGFTTFSAF